MKTRSVFVALSGREFYTEQQVLEDDFRHLRQVLEQKILFASLQRGENQFQTIKRYFVALYDKYQEYQASLSCGYAGKVEQGGTYYRPQRCQLREESTGRSERQNIAKRNIRREDDPENVVELEEERRRKAA